MPVTSLQLAIGSDVVVAFLSARIGSDSIAAPFNITRPSCKKAERSVLARLGDQDHWAPSPCPESPSRYKGSTYPSPVPDLVLGIIALVVHGTALQNVSIIIQAQLGLTLGLDSSISGA